jgi:hypothetical protein
MAITIGSRSLDTGSHELRTKVNILQDGSGNMRRLSAEAEKHKVVTGLSAGGNVTCNGAAVGDIVKFVESVNHLSPVIDRTLNFVSTVATINTLVQDASNFAGQPMHVILLSREDL